MSFLKRAWAAVIDYVMLRVCLLLSIFWRAD